jgi:hypothetical protein
MLVDIILKSSYAGDTRFDASQYAFFGNNVLEDFELGGFEDDNDSNAAFTGLDDLERPLSSQEIALEVGIMLDKRNLMSVVNTTFNYGK